MRWLFLLRLNPLHLIKRTKLSMVFIPCCSFVLMNYNGLNMASANT